MKNEILPLLPVLKKGTGFLMIILLSLLISPAFAQEGGGKGKPGARDTTKTLYESQPFKLSLNQIKSAQVPDDQRLLLYRKLMPFVQGGKNKNAVLNEIAKLKTYPAIFFVGTCLNDPATSRAAAKAAVNIALSSVSNNDGMQGSLVKEILINSVPLLKSSERENVSKYMDAMPALDGFYPMFNGKDLTGWQGLVGNPLLRAKMSPSELASKQAEADKLVAGNWSVRDNCIWFSGTGNNLCSIKEYGDFEMFVDWKITKGGDSGIYLRGSPQVQIWDPLRIKIGSGGLYNNKKNPSKPPVIADNSVGDWNTFRIVMKGEKVSVWLNGLLVVDNVILENYWDYSIPIFPKGAIELQAHGNELAFRDIYVKELSEK